MERAITDIENGSVQSLPLNERGDLYLGKMFTSKARGATWKKLQKGVISNYLKNKQSRDKKVLDSLINNFSNIKAP